MKNYNEILQDYLNDLAVLVPGIDISPASEVTIRAQAFSARVAELFYQQDLIQGSAFLDTATGEFLDRHVFQRGLDPRKEATRAAGVLRFSRATPSQTDRVIEAGTIASTVPDGSGQSVRFTTLSRVVLKAGELYVDAATEAVVPGDSGNIFADLVRNFVGVAPQGIETVTNPEPFTGGTDQESDEDLRERSLQAVRTSDNGGTADDYERWVMGVEGVTSALVLPLNRGPNTVDIVITSNGMPPDELLQDAQVLIDNKRPIGADARVVPPVPVGVDVDVSITPEDDVETAAVSSLVLDAVHQYIATVSVGGIVRRNGLMNAVHDVAGLLDYTLNAPAANIQLGATEFAQVGEVTIREQL
jgi:uncharacterized phage protein gp47/JayE